MPLIEQIEIDTIQEALKKPTLYFTWITYLIPLFYFTDYSSDWILLSALAFCLSMIFIIDIKHFIIPDSLQILIFIIINLLILTSPKFSAISAYSGAVFGFIIFYTLYYVYENILNKPALGFGDVKLFANAGLTLGFLYFNNFLLVLTAISIVALLIRLVIKPKEKLIPYGPMISVAIWLCVVFQHPINSLIQSNITKFIELII